MSYFENDDYTGGAKSDDEPDDSGSDTDLDENDLDENEVEEEAVDENEVVEEEEEDEDDGDVEEDDVEEDGEDEGEAKGGEGSDNEEDEVINTNKKVKKIVKKTIVDKSFLEIDSDDESDDDGETYLKKFDKEINDNYIVNYHPECALQNYDEILAMTKVVRDKNNIIIDDLHRTIPHLTKYERARILGQRAKQIESGATPFIKVPENVIDGYLIAELELQQSRIPFIIRRPMPNGGSEYWKINDLENIAF
jgi:DNA-directed RNA polymerase subunit K/omega